MSPPLKNHYRSLGIRANATAEQIKSAYRKLARQWHPDTGSEADEEQFKTIAEAYQVLGNPTSRKRYDELLYLNGQLDKDKADVLFDGFWVLAQLQELNNHIEQRIQHELFDDLIVSYIIHLLQQENRRLLYQSPEAFTAAQKELFNTAQVLQLPELKILIQFIDTHLPEISTDDNPWQSLLKQKEKHWRWEHFKPFWIIAFALIIALFIARFTGC